MIKLATRFDSNSNEFLVLIRAFYLLLLNIYGALISILKFFDLGYVIKCARTYSVWKDLVSEIVLRPIVRILVTLNLELDVSFLNEGTLSIKFKPQEVNVAKSKKVVSNELVHIAQRDVASLMECTEQLWIYIKENNLQDPLDHRFFVPDKNLSRIFGGKRVFLFGITKYLHAHLR